MAPGWQENGPLVIVPTEPVEDEERMVEVFGAYVANGFEGLMLRNRNTPYENKRSYNLQKVKLMQDAEFEVVGVLEGKGRMAGCAIFECRVSGDKTFTVKCEGALDDLADMFSRKDEYVGRQLTVRYQNLSNEGIPRFPVGVRFREDV
jgi:ATP-dependent DNA ligase